MAAVPALLTIPPRIAIACSGCGQIIAWRLVLSGALVPIIAANVSDEGPGTVRIRCHGCRRRCRIDVVEVAA